MIGAPLDLLPGRRPTVLGLRAGHDRRAVLDGDGAAQPQEGRHHRRAAPLRPRSHLRLPPHAARPPAGRNTIGTALALLWTVFLGHSRNWR